MRSSMDFSPFTLVTLDSATILFSPRTPKWFYINKMENKYCMNFHFEWTTPLSTLWLLAPWLLLRSNRALKAHRNSRTDPLHERRNQCCQHIWSFIAHFPRLLVLLCQSVKHFAVRASVLLTFFHLHQKHIWPLRALEYVRLLSVFVQKSNFIACCPPFSTSRKSCFSISPTDAIISDDQRYPQKKNASLHNAYCEQWGFKQSRWFFSSEHLVMAKISWVPQNWSAQTLQSRNDLVLSMCSILFVYSQWFSKLPNVKDWTSAFNFHILKKESNVHIFPLTRTVTVSF